MKEETKERIRKKLNRMFTEERTIKFCLFMIILAFILS